MNEKCTFWCDFCDALARTGDIGKTAEFEHHLGEDSLPSRTIFESEHFVVIASLGQIVEGYLLLLSKEHYPSMAHVPEALYEELNAVYSKTRLLLSQAYTSPLIFEHGPMPLGDTMNSPAGGGGSCVDHAHFHFVPVSISNHELISLLKERFPWRSVSHVEEIRVQVDKATPYFFVETSQGDRYVFDAPVAPPQYLRRLLSAFLGEPERWNWRIYPEIERVISTVQNLRHHISGVA